MKFFNCYIQTVIFISKHIENKVYENIKIRIEFKLEKIFNIKMLLTPFFYLDFINNIILLN